MMVWIITKNMLSDKGYVGFLFFYRLYLCTGADWLREGLFVSVHILFFCIHFAYIIYFIVHFMKQSSMFHRDDLLWSQNDDVNTDDGDNVNITNPVGPIIADIQKQQAKKTARLPKNNISDPMGVMIYNFIKLAGVKANPAKRIITLLSNKDKYDPKILSNMSELLQTNRFEPLALMFESTLDYYRRGIKSDPHKQQHIQTMENVFKNISYILIKSALNTKIQSIAQEFHATFCDVDMDPFQADKSIADRLDVLKQQLQHQLNDTYQFDNLCPCLRHNLSPPCKIKNCPWPHICRCGNSDHIMTDKHCPKYHMDDEKWFKKIKGMNNYHSKRANKSSKHDKWRQNNGQYYNNGSINQSTNNNKNDNNNNNKYNRQRR